MTSSDQIATDIFLPDQDDFWRPPTRFGSVPVEADPLGWDRSRRFEKHYPRIQLPMQIVERVYFGHDDRHEPNRLIWGDNLHVMRQLPSNSIDLIYIDPPFFSGRQYNVMWGDNHEMRSFNDIWEDGMPGYLIWLNARLFEMKRLLKPTGSIYVHCDWHASHYIKVEMDKIFGHDNFVNEVFWKRYAVHSLAESGYDNATDSILIYASVRSRMVFNKLHGELDQSEAEKRFPYLETETGRRYQHVALEQSSNSSSAGETREINGRIVESRLGWRWTQETFDTRISNNPHLIHWTRNGRPRYKIYADEYAGLPLGTMWSDVPYLSSGDSERIGYPTQKPEVLLDRIIRGSSNKGDIVADFVMGGGYNYCGCAEIGPKMDRVRSIARRGRRHCRTAQATSNHA